MASATHSPKSPWELYRIAKKQGAWDPEDIPIAEDKRDWEKLTPGQREQLVKICALFYEGEVSVADTLAWFIIAMPEQGRRAFLATQVIEEVKHAEFFALYFREILGNVDTQKYLVPEYRGVLLDELKQRGEAMGRAVVSGDAAAAEKELVLGVAHYMGVIEGMMAVSGYDYFDEMLGARGMFPRLLEGIRLIRADEGRHLTHGMDFLRQKIAAKPEYAQPVRALFMEQAMKIPARTDFVFPAKRFRAGPRAHDGDRVRAPGAEVAGSGVAVANALSSPPSAPRPAEEDFSSNSSANSAISAVKFRQFDPARIRLLPFLVPSNAANTQGAACPPSSSREWTSSSSIPFSPTTSAWCATTPASSSKKTSFPSSSRATAKAAFPRNW